MARPDFKRGDVLYYTSAAFRPNTMAGKFDRWDDVTTYDRVKYMAGGYDGADILRKAEPGEDGYKPPERYVAIWDNTYSTSPGTLEEAKRLAGTLVGNDASNVYIAQVVFEVTIVTETKFTEV